MGEPEKVVIVAARRSPFGRYLGALSALPAVDLAVAVGRSTLEEGGRDLTGAIDQVLVGNCIQAAFETASVNGRQIALKLGIGGFATTIDSACCSPLTALRMAVWGMQLGHLRSALVIGVESMSRVPHIARGLRNGVRVGAVELTDPIYPIEYDGYNPVSVDAARGAARYGVTKRMMDSWALGSHQKHTAASRQGRFDDELCAVDVPSRRGAIRVDADECPRPTTTLAKIEALPPVFGSGTITAGNAPGLNDGAAAMVVMTAGRAAELGLEPIAEIIETSEATDDPAGIAWVPALTIERALDRAGLRARDLDLIEINEAFAAMPLVSTRILAGATGAKDAGEDAELEARWQALLERTNVNGGAVAIGHPVGASGLRILATLAYELRRRGGGTGVAAICGGLTQGEAVLVRGVEATDG
jgi:acetyl-CoA C-acetyltransferase